MVEAGMANAESYDAAVIGAGPAGATAALILARAGWSVAVLEKVQFPRRKVCGEFLSATSLPLLRELGIAASFLAQAGPEIRQIGLYAGNETLVAEMPGTQDGTETYGRALGREHLDSLLLAEAAQAGARVFQPWAVAQVEKTERGFVVAGVARDTGEAVALKARIIIAAHGSWEPGMLPTQGLRYPPRASDLFAFKAHFKGCNIPPGLMPLVVFPGGYGGMVHSDRGRMSFSCCIRRDYLDQCRHRHAGMRAGEAVVAHIQASCRGVDEALAGARRDGAWLSTGPIRPGIRTFRYDGIFAVGNAAGEAHPIVAEGIGMAIQSAWLLCERLVAQRHAVFSSREVAAIGRSYEAGWRKNFSLRIHAASLFAHLAMRPAAAELAVAFLKRAPAIITLGAYLSGKAQPLRSVRKSGSAVS